MEHIEALNVLAIRSGRIQLSRALNDGELAERLLWQGVRDVLAFLELNA